MKKLQLLFSREQSPRKGLMALEWVVMAYLSFTLIFMCLTYTQLANPDAMLWLRVRVVGMTAAAWAVYRAYPCRLTLLARVVVQLSLLSVWYPDTYELNRFLPNLDHLFAQWEQQLFGCQPSLVFCESWTHPVFSELMDLGYASYFPMIALVAMFYFIFRYNEFERASLVIMASFFIYYVVFVFLPVPGPQYYYQAVGLDTIAKGIFPNIHDYFNHTQERMVSPGWHDGFFYKMVENAHEAGERPTAAFPSSHVGISTVLMLLAWHTRQMKLVWLLVPFFVLMFFATVYIRAHYAIDALAGLVSGGLLYAVLMKATRPAGAVE